MRLCMGSRRGFICRMKVGDIANDNMALGHLNRLKQRNSLGPSRDGRNYAVVHCTGYIKNWPPSGMQCLYIYIFIYIYAQRFLLYISELY